VAGDPAVGAHRAHPADAEQHLLQQPVVGAAAVQPVGDVPGERVVVGHVRVEQQQRHPAHLGDPDLGVQHPVLRQVDADPRGLAVRLLEQGERHSAGVEAGVVLELPALG